MAIYQAYYKIAIPIPNRGSSHIYNSKILLIEAPPFEAPNDDDEGKLAYTLARFRMKDYLPSRFPNMDVNESKLVRLVEMDENGKEIREILLEKFTPPKDNYFESKVSQHLNTRAR